MNLEEIVEFDIKDLAWRRHAFLSQHTVQTDSSAYTILPVVKTPNVDPGDTVRISVYVTGYGIPERNKLTIGHTHPNVWQDEDVGEIITSISEVKITSKSFNFVIAGKPAVYSGIASSKGLDKFGVHTVLSQGYFADDPRWLANVKDRPQQEVEAFPQTLGEVTRHEYPPIEIRYNVSDQATSGDYEIHFVLTYGDGEKIKQAESVATFHINNWREQKEPWPTRAGIAAAIFALLSLLLTAEIPTKLFNFLLSSVGIFPLVIISFLLLALIEMVFISGR